MNIAGKEITDMHHFVYSKISCKLKRVLILCLVLIWCCTKYLFIKGNLTVQNVLSELQKRLIVKVNML